MDIANGCCPNDQDRLYCKHDGSLDDGFELVTHPMTLEYHMNKMPWPDVLTEAIKMGYTSHRARSCGLHVHVNRDAFGKTEAEQEAVIAHIMFFVENHWNELLRFSRRTKAQMEHWAARYGRKDDPKAMMDHAKQSDLGRYTCVNLTNESTIEFRMFQGTLKLNTFLDGRPHLRGGFSFVRPGDAGTDATGAAYVQNGTIRTQKAPRPAHKMKWRIDPAARYIMGHTRMATQGSEKLNYNNHPFPGKAGQIPFALAHNGVLYHESALRQSYNLPHSKIETDSYVAVQLLEHEGNLSDKSIRRMAEALDGTFTITILDARNNMHFVKGNNPLTVILLPDLGCYLYASTDEILRAALDALGMSDVRAMAIPVEQGEILRIDAHGQRTKSRFNDSKLYDYTRYLGCWPSCRAVELTDDDHA